jgi:adenylosuccinate lyase
VKAIEYFLKERLEEVGLKGQQEFVHFALTSQDINNTALPLLIKDFVFEAYLPAMHAIRDRLHGLALDWSQVAMLASRVPAVPYSETGYMQRSATVG